MINHLCNNNWCNQDIAGCRGVLIIQLTHNVHSTQSMIHRHDAWVSLSQTTLYPVETARDLSSHYVTLWFWF